MKKTILTTALAVCVIFKPFANPNDNEVKPESVQKTILLRDSRLRSTWPDHPDIPYRLSWKTDLVTTAVGTGLFLYANSLDNSRTPLMPEQANEFTHKDVNWFDRSATYKYNPKLRDVSDQLGAFALVVPLTLLADGGVRRDIVTVGTLFLQTRLFAYGTANISKRSINRYRPYIYNPGVSYEDKIAKDPGKSFFAQQTTSVFSTAIFVATVFSDYHPDSKFKPWIWAGTLAAATAISYVRYETGIHYTSDILVGALVGSAIGYGIPKIHKSKKKNLSLNPIIQGDIYALSAVWKL
ncbi:phosphatase PAP2 family protein [Negadavirga shengliensis]|uniref:Phosphatase PAP2 family protein n=1 Tax=Negadavirga shengliensis TaxID=1389218 RepID=A0ABV9SWN4_9BACT